MSTSASVLASALLGMASLLSSASLAHADWVGPSRTAMAGAVMEIRVEEGRVEVDLEIGASALRHFRDLLDSPRHEAEFGEDAEGERARRSRFFSESGLRIRTSEAGEVVPGTVLLFEERERVPDESPPANDGLIAPERSPRILFARLEYLLPAAPGSIQILPPAPEGGDGDSPSIGFVTLHLGMPIHDLRYLRRAEELELDWGDAWRSRYASEDLRRHHLRPILDYVYIGEFEVRHEILLRVRDLSSWITLAVEDPGVIAAGERAAVARQVGDLLLEHNPIAIDGELAPPTLERVDYVDIGLRGIAVDGGEEAIPMARALVGVVLSYPIDGLPDALEMRWDLFDETITEVPAFTVAPFVDSPRRLTPESPSLIWRRGPNPRPASAVRATRVDSAPVVIRVPLLAGVALFGALIYLVYMWRQREETWRHYVVDIVSSLFVVIAAAALGGTVEFVLSAEEEVSADPSRARAALSGVLENVYRSFEAREEGAVLERLDVSVEDATERAFYLEHRRTFAMEAQGGAVAEVDRVELIDIEELRVVDGALRMRASWLASGTVNHWGQARRRTHRYLANVTLSPVDGFWKLGAFEVVEFERLR